MRSQIPPAPNFYSYKEHKPVAKCRQLPKAASYKSSPAIKRHNSVPRDFMGSLRLLPGLPQPAAGIQGPELPAGRVLYPPRHVRLAYIAPARGTSSDPRRPLLTQGTRAIGTARPLYSHS